MTPERLSAAETIFVRAIDVPREHRAAFLREACGENTGLRSDVERLLAEDEAGGTWFTEVVPSEAGRLIEEAPIGTGAVIGSYRVEHILGSGGMGAVYLATRADQQYEKRVAVKVLRAGFAGLTARGLFLRERQILAQMDHPYIARLLDGGTLANGQPYLVLDFVEGLPLTAYCEKAEASLNDRIALFIKVCEGVSYAHQNLIVHRDLKPANILVGADGIPKLLDFGIAKLLGASSGSALLTQLPGAMMTPQYCSPEQLRGEAITTATDVYSLGVILYELVTGHKPYELEGLSLTSVVKKVLEEPVERPSRRKSRIPADLDNIVLKALEKDPARRYRSADQLADDLRRFEQGRPVLARGNSLAYRAQKFIRRHWVPVAAAAAIVASLAALAIESRNNAAEQVRLRQAADRRFQQVRQLANKFLFEFHDAIQMLPGSTPARRLVVKTALEYLDGLTRDRPSDVQLLAEAATAYERVGDVQGNSYFANLGDTAGALASYQKALEFRQRVPRNNSLTWRDWISSHIKLGDIASQQGQTEESARRYNQAIALAAQAPGEDRLLLDINVKALLRRADLREKLNQARPSLADLERARELTEKLRDLDPAKPLHLSELSIIWNKIGRIRHNLGDPAGYIEARRKGLEQANRAVAMDSANQVFLRSKMISHLGLGDALAMPAAGKLRDLDAALVQLKQALDAAETIRRMDPENTQANTDAAIVWSQIGLWHEDKEQWPQAVVAHRKSLAIVQELARRNPQSLGFQKDVADYRQRVGASLAEIPDYENSLKEMRASLDTFEKLGAKDPSDHDITILRLQAWRDLGEILRLSGHPAESVEPNLKAVRLLQGLIAGDPGNGNLPNHISPIFQQLGKSYADLAKKAADAAERRRHWQASLEWWQKAKQAGGPAATRPAIAEGIAAARAAIENGGH